MSDAVLPLIPAVLEEEDPMPLYALKLLVVLLDTHPTWALHLQRYAPNSQGYGREQKGILRKTKRDTHLGTAPAEVCTKVKYIPTWALHLQGYAKLAAC